MGRTATLVGARPVSLRAQARPAVRVRDLADVPAVLAPVNAQAMAGPVVVAVLDSEVDHTVPATEPMRLQLACHVTPRR